jgi:hypothetical protein
VVLIVNNICVDKALGVSLSMILIKAGYKNIYKSGLEDEASLVNKEEGRV